MGKAENKEQAFMLGVFTGELLMSKGAIQPDFQLDNIGIRNGMPCLLDYADIVFVNLPADLSKDIIKAIKESLFSLTDNYEVSFKHNSHVRVGFIFRTGMLGHIIYESARNNGYSSFTFVEKGLKRKEHSLARITKWSDVKSVIGDWKEIPLDLFGTEKLNCLDNKKHVPTYDVNDYYLKNTIHILALADKSIMSENSKANKIYLDASLTALQFGLPYTAYGFAKKCKALTNNIQVVQLCDMVFEKTQEYIEEYKDVVDRHVDREAFELMWILEDLDISITK
ncbi:hypothetical protein [uncultured Tyzzerella sp.]|uniref:hypothetical protein n=1 Tax=uncultured Tyzzerella sp. TaxID=2321398 RepID=UPI0029437D28|nr:hypothetical protein [uncultured Tyzzerella sp.]